MQQDQVAEFFTRLVILIAFLLVLAVIAIPEVASMLEESYTESSEVEFMDSSSAISGIIDESASGSVTGIGLVVRL
jgi:hypothetical protein